MIKLFTHTDLDGVGCAVLAKIAFGSDVDITYCNYDEINQKVEDFFDNNTNIYCHITDISVTEELAAKIDTSADKYFYFLFDHHPTALSLNQYDWCTVTIDQEKTGIKTSGTELYYQWLVKERYLESSSVLNRFVSLVRNYDTWRWTTLANGFICKQVNDLLYLYGRDKFIDWCITKIKDSTFPALNHIDKLILEIKQKEIDDYVEEKDKQLIILPFSVLNKTCGYIFAEKYFSELGNRLCKMHPEIDFVAMINMSNQTVSYRTVKNDIDLGQDIAKLYGGGGHPKAAGSEFTEQVCLEVIDNIFKL